MSATTPPVSMSDIRITETLGYEGIRRNAKESELDALIDMRATEDFCDRREALVKTWPAGYSGNYSAYQRGTLDGIKEYRDVYMSREDN